MDDHGSVHLKNVGYHLCLGEAAGGGMLAWQGARRGVIEKEKSGALTNFKCSVLECMRNVNNPFTPPSLA